MLPNKYNAPRAAAPAAVKLRKQRAPKPRAHDFTHADWKADVERRSIVSGERTKRGVAKKKRDAVAAAEEEASHELMAKDRQQPRPPHASQYAQGVWAASQQSVVSPASFLPPSFTAFAIDPRAPPAFAIDPRGPPRGLAFTADLNIPYRYSTAYLSSPNPRRGALPFGPGSSSTPQFSATDAEINNMIITGSAAAVASKGFYVDVQEPGAETKYTEQEDAEEEVEEVDAPDPRVAGKKRKRAPASQKPTEPCLKWTLKEDACLAEAWKTVSIDPITGANQNSDNYWRPSSSSSMSLPRLSRARSGSNAATLSPRTRRPSTTQTRLSSGRPIGNKKAKAARDMAPVAERLQSSIDQCIAHARSHAVVREEKFEARWTAMMKNQDAKLDLLRTNVAAKKRNNDLAFLMGVDTAAMDPLVRAWFIVERAIILN
ncbi:unnamed protein product [Alopecurus aequalis]